MILLSLGTVYYTSSPLLMTTLGTQNCRYVMQLLSETYVTTTCDFTARFSFDSTYQKLAVKCVNGHHIMTQDPATVVNACQLQGT